MRKEGREVRDRQRERRNADIEKLARTAANIHTHPSTHTFINKNM